MIIMLTVSRVILEGDRATAVKTVPSKPLGQEQNHSKVYKARKYIIVSGGTLSSPLILQRSGIGKNCPGHSTSVVTHRT